MLYVGGGVGMVVQAVPALPALVEETGIPAVVTLKGLGSVDANSDLYLGMHGTKAANLAV